MNPKSEPPQTNQEKIGTTTAFNGYSLLPLSPAFVGEIRQLFQWFWMVFDQLGTWQGHGFPASSCQFTCWPFFAIENTARP